jgi:DeoR family transcriptional regulator, aga operon transcriptional repressor
MGNGMKKAERWNAILQRLADDGSLAVTDIAGDLGVSDSTIRRDLTELEVSNLLHRVHGGAMATGVLNEQPLSTKSTQHLEQKRAIAAEAATRLTDGMAVGLSGGTTVTELAKILTGQRVTVVTNALNIAAMLVVWPNVELIVTGGIGRPKTAELVGSIAESTIAALNLDMAFVGADGISASAGLTTHNVTEARTNLTLIRRTNTTICLADSSKIGRASFAQICPFTEITELITDDGADPSFVAALKDMGVVVTTISP